MEATEPLLTKVIVDVTTNLTNGFSREIVKLTNGSSHTDPEGEPQLLVLSAASQASLSSMAENLKCWVSAANPKTFKLSDLAYTLGVRRSIYSWKYAFVASSPEEVVSQLSKLGLPKSKSPTISRLTFIFTGQGAQWYAMGRELFLASNTYRESITKSDSLLRSLGCPWSLAEELLRSKEYSKMGNSELAQPATTAIQIALVNLLASFGIKPERVCGHSSGEIAAAFATGALTHEAAVEVSVTLNILLRRSSV